MMLAELSGRWNNECRCPLMPQPRTKVAPHVSPARLRFPSYRPLHLGGCFRFARAGPAKGTVGQYSDAVIEGSVLEPEPIVVSDDAKLAGLITVPDGFEVSVAARDLGNTRMIGVHHSGRTAFPEVYRGDAFVAMRGSTGLRAFRAEVLTAMDGHVLAKGEFVGLFQRPAAERAEN